MAKTVVGLFNSVVEAQRIKHELINDGFQASDLQVVASDEASSTASTSGYTSTGATTASSQDTGVISSIKNFFASLTDAGEEDRTYYSEGVNRGGALLSATVPDNAADALAARLEQYGAKNVEEKEARGIASASGTKATNAPTRTAATAATGDVAIPIVEEDLQVGKRQVSRGGVRVYSHLVETPVEENVQLREEHVRVQRNPVNRTATAADFEAFKEGTVELTETAEEAVVSKQARVVEEVTVGKDVTERTETIRDSVRHTEVDVENLGTDELKRKATSNKP